MEAITLKAKGKLFSGTVELPASKSIANRLLVINALSGNKITIHNLSSANDTVVLQGLLSNLRADFQNQVEINCEDAGTVMRFLTACFATTPGRWLLKGTERMHHRPISILVNTLRELGANIEYAGQEGFPPLLITGRKLKGGSIDVDASVSSQYISALMMIAPYLEGGLKINLRGKISSQPYLRMTAGLMQQCGAAVITNGNSIVIKQGDYKPAEISVESDWSAASYWYALQAVSGGGLKLPGLQPDSLQGDSVVAELMKGWVSTRFDKTGAILAKTEDNIQPFEIDFSNCPDLAPTFIALYGALGIKARFTGLESLAIKESDRTAAMAAELAKVNIQFIQNNNYWELTPNPDLRNIAVNPVFASYNDHRIAMALSIFSCVLSEIKISGWQSVNKSYPSFWDEYARLLG